MQWTSFTGCLSVVIATSQRAADVGNETKIVD